MKNAVERELIREYNKAYSKILHVERKKRKLTLEKLAFGIMSRSKLEDLEKSNAQWTKLEGDTLMLRMGILPEYFESLASGKELEQWRLRESACWYPGILKKLPPQSITTGSGVRNGNAWKNSSC